MRTAAALIKSQPAMSTPAALKERRVRDVFNMLKSIHDGGVYGDFALLQAWSAEIVDSNYTNYKLPPSSLVSALGHRKAQGYGSSRRPKVFVLVHCCHFRCYQECHQIRVRVCSRHLGLVPRWSHDNLTFPRLVNNSQAHMGSTIHFLKRMRAQHFNFLAHMASPPLIRRLFSRVFMHTHCKNITARL